MEKKNYIILCLVFLIIAFSLFILDYLKENDLKNKALDNLSKATSIDKNKFVFDKKVNKTDYRFYIKNKKGSYYIINPDSQGYVTEIDVGSS